MQRDWLEKYLQLDWVSIRNALEHRNNMEFKCTVCMQRTVLMETGAKVQSLSMFPFKWYEKLPSDFCFNFSPLERGLAPLKQATVPSWELDVSSQLHVLFHMHEDIR